MSEPAALEVDRPEAGRRRRRRRKGLGRTLGRIAPGLLGAGLGVAAADVLGGGTIPLIQIVAVALISGLAGWGVMRLLQPRQFG